MRINQIEQLSIAVNLKHCGGTDVNQQCAIRPKIMCQGVCDFEKWSMATDLVHLYDNIVNLMTV